MTRTIDEWRGKTDDTKAPPRVRARIFLAHDGICFLTKRKIMPADYWELDHRVALINGGENREGNLVPVLRDAHRIKTRTDVLEKSKVARMRNKHIGIKKRSTFACSRDSKFKRKMNGEVVLR